MRIQVNTSIALGKDETSKKLAELIKNGEKIFWIKGVSVNGKRLEKINLEGVGAGE
jgi:hypothetical protein